MNGHTYSKTMNQLGKVANPARVKPNRVINIPLSPFAPENLVSRDGFGSPVPRQPAHLDEYVQYSQAHSAARAENEV